MIMMDEKNKQVLIGMAVSLLENTEVEEVEEVEVTTTKYTDGSTCLTIEIHYPADEGDPSTGNPGEHPTT